ncbi:hypothetical protein JTE90_019509 [Oedothorax gibbosus]|uniref:Uncharacterized protein n=1 Tax=Oedothorax gibbosus TaxID=931172 RepID=A0AAV6VFS9_9ARAC|nr:hypothetical protein JTE90_019509 [Oedothorax gibbosus]
MKPWQMCACVLVSILVLQEVCCRPEGDSRSKRQASEVEGRQFIGGLSTLGAFIQPILFMVGMANFMGRIPMFFTRMRDRFSSTLAGTGAPAGAGRKRRSLEEEDRTLRTLAEAQDKFKLNRIYGSKDSTSPKIKYDQGLKKKSCAPEQEIPKEFEVSLELVDDRVCDPTTTLSPSTPHQLPSPVGTPLEINSPSRDEAGSSRLSQFRLPSSPLLVSCPTENVEPPPSSGLSANWLKRKRQPNASVRSADALSADTLSRKTAVERETLQRMAHAKKEHELRMAVMEEKVLMLRAKRAYYERGNKN